jgi:hypothetical protein
VARTAGLTVLGAFLIATSWLRLENPHGPTGSLVWMIALVILAAHVSPLRARIAAVTAVGLFVSAHTLSVPLRDLLPFDGEGFFGPLLSRFSDGFLEFYDVQLPFDAAGHPLMHAAILLAIFGFSLALAVAAAARKPAAAAAIVVVGAGWPATLLPGRHAFALGAEILAVVLALLAGLRDRPPARPSQALLAGGALVVAALLASSLPGVAKGAFLDWQHWDLYTRPQKPVSLRFIWEANYKGIQFPKKVTEVLRVHAPHASLYWRATTLDIFHGDRWLESLAPVVPGDRSARPLDDPLLPAVVRDRNNWVRTEVEIRALSDNHLPGGSIPVDYAPGDVRDVLYKAGGIAITTAGLARGDRYTVWSYAIRPSPAELAASPPKYPSAILPFLGVNARNGVTVPPFGAPNRGAAVRRVFADNLVLSPYRALYRTAQEVVGDAASPYAAAVQIENWLRTTGGFRYDEHPPVPSGLPPLVGFVEQTRRGYCQFFAGAMALMLRYLGVPARVAAGFTSGQYDARHQEWHVTDHDAHTWVEVWFRDFGWLPFDPTPGRGELSGLYTSSSPNFDPAAVGAILRNAVLAANEGKPGDFGQKGLRRATDRPGDIPGETSGGGSRGVGGPSASLLRLLAILLAALVGLIAVVKLAVRRVRYLTRDPRRVASACRRELADFLVDQQLELQPGSTLSDFAALLDRELDVAAEGFVHSANAARFGPPSEAQAAASRARAELRGLLHVLRSRLSRYERVRGLVSLRSLGFSG